MADRDVYVIHATAEAEGLNPQVQEGPGNSFDEVCREVDILFLRNAQDP